MLYLKKGNFKMRDIDKKVLKVLIAGVLVGVAAAAILLFYSLYVKQSQKTIFVGGQDVSVVVASTPEARARGLSETSQLDPNNGMLFVFDDIADHGIWMKDMNYPIDIVWLSDSKHVVHIEKNISPDTYPEIFRPSQPAKYVLEVPASFSDENDIQPGLLLIF